MASGEERLAISLLRERQGVVSLDFVTQKAHASIIVG